MPVGNAVTVPAAHDAPSADRAIGPSTADAEIATNILLPYVISCHNDDAIAPPAAQVDPLVDVAETVPTAVPPAIATNLPAPLAATDIHCAAAPGRVDAANTIDPFVMVAYVPAVEVAVPPDTPTHLFVACELSNASFCHIAEAGAVVTFDQSLPFVEIAVMVFAAPPCIAIK